MSKKQKDMTLRYKIRIVADIEGEVSGQPPLMEDTGIAPFISWAEDDISEKLQGECTVVGVKSVELKEVEG